MPVMDQLTGLIGVGYQGHDIRSFIDEVTRQEVKTLIDVRLTPISRKPGFSKRALATALEGAGIRYLHAPELGNPKWNRAAFSGDADELSAARDRYARRLESTAAQQWLTSIAAMASVERVALLCFEADQRRCHRDVVAQAVAAQMAR